MSVLFYFLVLVGCGSSIVPPPANVTVSCRGFQTVVYWNYSGVEETYFRVTVKGRTSEGHEALVTRDLRMDLTDVLWRGGVVAPCSAGVTAETGGRRSEMAASPTFSFNRLLPAKKHCRLDLPPVELHVTGARATVTFGNPQRIHQELRGTEPRRLEVRVTEDNITYTELCLQNKSVCTLQFHPQHRKDVHCVSVGARLVSHSEVLEFNERRLVCVKQSGAAETDMIVFGTLMFVFVIVSCAIAGVIWKVRACVLNSPPSPSSLVPQTWSASNPAQNVMDLRPEELTFDRAVETDALNCTAAAQPWDPEESDGGRGPDSDPPTPSGCAYYKGGLSESSDQESSESGGAAWSRAEDPLDGEGGAAAGEEVSPYDQPHHLAVDMGRGDMVVSYGPL